MAMVRFVYVGLLLIVAQLQQNVWAKTAYCRPIPFTNKRQNNPKAPQQQNQSPLQNLQELIAFTGKTAPICVAELKTSGGRDMMVATGVNVPEQWLDYLRNLNDKTQYGELNEGIQPDTINVLGFNKELKISGYDQCKKKRIAEVPVKLEDSQNDKLQPILIMRRLQNTQGGLTLVHDKTVDKKDLMLQPAWRRKLPGKEEEKYWTDEGMILSGNNPHFIPFSCGLPRAKSSVTVLCRVDSEKNNEPYCLWPSKVSAIKHDVRTLKGKIGNYDTIISIWVEGGVTRAMSDYPGIKCKGTAAGDIKEAPGKFATTFEYDEELVSTSENEAQQQECISGKITLTKQEGGLWEAVWEHPDGVTLKGTNLKGTISETPFQLGGQFTGKNLFKGALYPDHFRIHNDIQYFHHVSDRGLLIRNNWYSNMEFDYHGYLNPAHSVDSKYPKDVDSIWGSEHAGPVMKSIYDGRCKFAYDPAELRSALERVQAQVEASRVDDICVLWADLDSVIHKYQNLRMSCTLSDSLQKTIAKTEASFPSKRSAAFALIKGISMLGEAIPIGAQALKGVKASVQILSALISLHDAYKPAFRQGLYGAEFQKFIAVKLFDDVLKLAASVREGCAKKAVQSGVDDKIKKRLAQALVHVNVASDESASEAGKMFGDLTGVVTTILGK